MSTPMVVIQIAKDKELAASGTHSEIIPIEQSNFDGYFSLQLVVSAGTGVFKAEYQLSNNGTNYVEPTGATDIATTFGASSGPGSDGIDLYTFTPDLAAFMKILFTETGGANSVTFSAWLACQ